MNNEKGLDTFITQRFISKGKIYKSVYINHRDGKDNLTNERKV